MCPEFGTGLSNGPSGDEQAGRERRCDVAEGGECGIEEHRARAEAASQQHEIRERWATIHAALGAELSGTRDRFPQERAQADVHLSEARREARDMTWQQVSAERELGAYREVTYWRYCICVARG